jgi:hypothetical protein
VGVVEDDVGGGAEQGLEGGEIGEGGALEEMHGGQARGGEGERGGARAVRIGAGVDG